MKYFIITLLLLNLVGCERNPYDGAITSDGTVYGGLCNYTNYVSFYDVGVDEYDFANVKFVCSDNTTLTAKLYGSEKTNYSISPSELKASKGMFSVFSLEFFPDSLGDKDIKIEVYSSTDSKYYPISVRGSAILKSFVNISPDDVNFSTVKVGTSVSKNVYVKNETGFLVNIDSVKHSNSNYSLFTLCRGNYRNGESCWVTVYFEPTEKGEYKDELVVSYSIEGYGSMTSTASFYGKGE